MEFDRLILNDDDHFNNIAFIRDAKGAYRAAPVFDNGGAFLSDTRECYPLEKNTIGLINEVSAKPFDKNFDKQTEMLISLYGSQLCLYKDAQITPEIKQEITTQYGQVITDRISKVLDHSMYLYPEYFCLDRELEQYKKKREYKINRYIDKQNANREETRKKTHIVKKNKDNELQ